MNRLVAMSRYLAIAGVFFCIIAATTAFGWGAFKTTLLVNRLLHGGLDGMAVSLMQIMDGFLIAAGLLIFALGMYELFIGEIELPAWLVIHDLDALKSKLAGIIVMVMAVTFLERLENIEEAHGLLEAGVSVAMVSAVLVWMARSTRPPSQ